jgi:hypothetical protein
VEFAALERVDVEEDSWDGDDLVADAILEEDHAVVERGGEAGHVRPDVERAARLLVDLDAQRLELLEQVVALRAGERSERVDEASGRAKERRERVR